MMEASSGNGYAPVDDDDDDDDDDTRSRNRRYELTAFSGAGFRCRFFEWSGP